ncbi:MAG TPA: YqgE/AlgH family protein [Burkholderiales bacterium]|jgi:putative transcriptional regulator|nr:YqgE/AlgH family protein [Burkholderiales bacterium]
MLAIAARTLMLAWLLALGAIATLARAQDEAPSREAILLVAHPLLLDPNFSQSVVLVTFPPDSGPMGVILNRPSGVELRSIWPDRPERQGRSDIIHFGGPLEPDGLLFVFRMTPAPVRALWVTEDIYFSGDGQLLERLLEEERPVPHQRFFAGYSGWARGQLESEISGGSWYVLPVDAGVIFDMPVESMWEKLFERATLPRAAVENRS